jgi:hypothetical protein
VIKKDIRTVKTPNGMHLYAAYKRGHGTYGWGNTPAEARAKLAANLAAETKPGA